MHVWMVIVIVETFPVFRFQFNLQEWAVEEVIQVIVSFPFIKIVKERLPKRQERFPDDCEYLQINIIPLLCNRAC